MKATIEIKMKAVIFSEEGMQSVTEVLGWLTPAPVYHKEINFNENRKYLSSGQKLCPQNGY